MDSKLIPQWDEVLLGERSVTSFVPGNGHVVWVKQADEQGRLSTRTDAGTMVSFLVDGI